MKNKYNIFITALAVVLLITGCYTSFQHPSVDSQGRKINTSGIYVSGKCYDCHQEGTMQETSVLPAAVENNYDWQFYTNSEWWQDEFDFFPVNSVDGVEATGPRLPGVSPETIDHGVTSIPVITAPASLGKKSSDTTTEQNDNRRDFDRRQDTKKSDEQSQGSSGDTSRNR